MSLKLDKKNTIKIPTNISIYLCKNNILTLIGPLDIRSIKLKVKVEIISERRILVIKQFLNENCLYINENKLKILINNYIIIIKQIINEITSKSKQKVNFIGIGYRATIITILDVSILHLKLGFSHQIYIKIPSNMKIICPKTTKLFIFGYNQQKINKLATLIKSYKVPEPYKGKGIFYDNEKIILKKGKKI